MPLQVGLRFEELEAELFRREHRWVAVSKAGVVEFLDQSVGRPRLFGEWRGARRARDTLPTHSPKPTADGRTNAM
jgi:hypothetical protein